MKDMKLYLCVLHVLHGEKFCESGYILFDLMI